MDRRKEDALLALGEQGIGWGVMMILLALMSGAVT